MKVAKITRLLENGGRMDWGHNNLIVYDFRVGRDDYHDIWTMNPDGSNKKPLTVDSQGKCPQRHNGNPAWHPSCDWIVFQAEKDEHPETPWGTLPGFGLWNDLWVMTPDGKDYWQLTSVAADRAAGNLHPHFSHDGKKLLWGNMLKPVPFDRGFHPGNWEICVADFLTTPQPHLENITSSRPGPYQSFYETHGFIGGDREILFTGHWYPETPGAIMHICTMDLATGETKNLTPEKDQWNEHAHMRPQEDKIVWMSSRDVEFDPMRPDLLTTELWTMNADGSDRERLTYFSDPASSHWMGQTRCCGDNAWSPDGMSIVVYTLFDRPNQHGDVLRLDLEE